MQHVHPTVSLFAAPEKLTSLMESGVSTIAFTSNWGDPPKPGSYWEVLNLMRFLKLPDSHRQRMPIVPAPMQATTEAQSTHRVHGNGESRNDVGCEDHEHTQRE